MEPSNFMFVYSHLSRSVSAFSSCQSGLLGEVETPCWSVKYQSSIYTPFQHTVILCYMLPPFIDHYLDIFYFISYPAMLTKLSFSLWAMIIESCVLASGVLFICRSVSKSGPMLNRWILCQNTRLLIQQGEGT
jgi:hypothetical protein